MYTFFHCLHLLLFRHTHHIFLSLIHIFYVGNTFDKKANKGYKTIQNAKKEAEKNGLSVWDEEGAKLYLLKVEVTDDVPDDAALEEKPDGSVNA